jgi:hypothetical protein
MNGFSQQPGSNTIKIFRDDLNPPKSWSHVAEELNNPRNISQGPDWMSQQNSGWHNDSEVEFQFH